MTGKLFLSVLLLLVVACPRFTNSQSIENAAIEREEYAVYSATLSTLQEWFQPKQWVIANPTLAYGEIQKKYVYFALKGAPIASDEIFEDHSRRNKSNRWLERRLELKTEYVIVDFREIKKIFDLSDSNYPPKSFSEKYPGAGGFIRLSRVGFNSAMDEALVLAAWSCGILCGQGELLFFSKKNGVWTVVNRAMLFQS
jgi:hypothetical protein